MQLNLFRSLFLALDFNPFPLLRILIEDLLEDKGEEFGRLKSNLSNFYHFRRLYYYYYVGGHSVDF